jgi:serine/threonine protein kinase
LEEAKGDQQKELEEQLEGHWIQPLNKKPGREIMNRVIKVWSEDSEEYYVADVAQFDAVSGQHQLMYRDNADDCWTDLSKEKWMLLDEEGQQYAIARKVRDDNDGDSLLLAPPPSISTGTSPRSDSMSRSSSPVPSTIPGVKTKNYVYIQTPIKDEMGNRHTLFKCGRFCRVHIDVVQLSVSENTDSGDEDMKKAMAESEDGSIWKLVVTGADVQKAVEYLQKMDIILYNNLHGIENVSSNLTKGGSAANLTDATTTQSTGLETELIFPRLILEQVRKRFFSLKGYCYDTEVEFVHSDSKSKQFAKFILKSQLGSALERSLEYLNRELTQICLEADAPKTAIGVYKDFGYLGGEMSNEDVRLLFHTKRTLTKWTECSEDLQGSTFASSFEEANRCSIWIQAEEDMGRVSQNKVIMEADPQKPRKIFFGVSPNRVPVLWAHLLSRIADLKRGVQFLHLGADRIYQPILLQQIKKNGRPGTHNYFFDFVQATSGASVRIDSITGNHLRIDGGDSSISESAARQVTERIDIAMEMISLQIELLRDHHIRQQRWGFGRDWALLLTSDAKTLNQIDSSTSTQDLTSLSSKSTAHIVRNLDNRGLGAACLEISEIVSSAGLSERVAAHACIIFYRYTSLPSNANALNTNFKVRDAQLASLFIANKSQKVMKWKRLEAVLEHAYKVFYPGSYFNPEGEEAKNWEKRVISAEKTVLLSLNYDVFWTDVDWVINAIVGTNAMSEPIAQNTMTLALSGHVLAAGPMLWLKYGPKYAFAAIAGYLSLDLEKIFHALSLVPLTVSHAAELIYNSSQAMLKVKKNASYQSSKHEIFNEMTMKSKYQQIQSDCAAYMNKNAGQIFSDSNFVASPEYKAISHRARLRRVFKGVRSDVVEENLLPLLGKICFESNCNIRFSEGASEGTHDVVLEGNWKALAIAEHLFLLAVRSASPPSAPAPNSYAAMSNSYNSYIAQDFNLPSDGNDVKQVKVQPGLLGMSSVSDKFGWEGTVECATDYKSSEVYDAGHKTCIAAQASQEDLDAAGLRWWVPHKYGPSLDGSLCEILSSPKILSNGQVDMSALALLAQSFTGGHASLQSTFPTLATFLPPPDEFSGQKESHSIAISLMRWPPEKIETKEQSSAGQGMQMGFSVAALQEMQLLHQLHILIPSPKGHPNFILPLAIALESDNDESKDSSSSLGGSKSSDAATEQILAMIERNQKVAGKKRHAASGSHLVLEPTPLVLQKVMAQYQRKNNGGSLIPPTVLASLCHDILSAISFCHSNHIILRSLLPDMIHIDHCGTAKLSGLSKVMVLHGKDRTKDFNPLKYLRDKRKSRDHNTEDVEPFAAPELLLGGNRHTKESDMWAFGALLANLLIGKQLFPGKDRVSKMTQVFKIVGVPTEENYPDAKRFPFYSNNMYVIGDDNKKKRYPRGVVKALRHMLKSFEGCNIDDYADLISLLDGILHLDPKERMTADEALRHSYMSRHSAHVQDQEFRQSYVKDWVELKENVLSKGNSSSAGKNGNSGDLSLSMLNNDRNTTNDSKRKAVVFGGDAEDDLYNLDDIIGSSPKRPKTFD